jgi:hypothetical protein
MVPQVRQVFKVKLAPQVRQAYKDLLDQPVLLAQQVPQVHQASQVLLAL